MNYKNFYKQKSVLISGGAGFIGSHIAETLVSLGAKVKIVDNLSTGSEKNIETIKKPSKSNTPETERP